MPIVTHCEWGKPPCLILVSYLTRAIQSSAPVEEYVLASEVPKRRLILVCDEERVLDKAVTNVAKPIHK